MKKYLLIFFLVSQSCFAVTGNKVWRVPNAGTFPSWGPINLTDSTNAVTGLLPGANIANNVPLTGKAVTEGGLNVVVSNTNATNSLSIVRGRVAANGSIISGEGFSVSGPSSGVYTITFTTSFGDTPAIALSPETAGTYLAAPQSILAGSFNAVVKFADSPYASTTIPFTFIAVGQRP